MSLVETNGTGYASNADWSAYATAYDLLSRHNPEYKALMREFEEFLAEIDAPKIIYDVGGGTGNYTEIAARLCPESSVCLVEPDPGMMQAAKAKLSARKNVTYQNVGLENAEVPEEADLLISVHSLYAMPDPHQRLADMRRMLRRGGLLYLVDLGRPMDVQDWRRFLFSRIRQEHGLFGALMIFWQGRQIAKQNKAIFEAQQDGTYWTHSAEEIAAAVTAAGFDILDQRSVYRGYSDLLVCRATP
ncbi:MULTISPECIES: class I SAM-dependent methyltransferase [unclassified Roseovarius]|uniref:class I SAM-dependent methyltransferase n=1 Tax=unclassified Roseovarius TaxID=2614913 RepID=UPI00273ED0C6|nr:class I SAM-dependent methyltransferase [Roseovarius sp. MMSF_3350]